MDAHELLNQVTGQLGALTRDAVDGLVRSLPALGEDPSAAGTVLAGRLLAVHDQLPPGNSLVELVREMLGDLDSASPVRLHGWRRAPGAQLGVALVLTDPSGPTAGRAVLGVTPDGPVFDVVVTPGTTLNPSAAGRAPWSAEVTIAAPQGWDAAFGPGLPTALPGGTATIRLRRTGRLAAGMADGPGVSVDGIALTVTASPGTPAAAELELQGFNAAVLPAALARLLGLGGASPMAGPPPPITLRADRAEGLRFAGGALRVPLPMRLNAPLVSTRGAALELLSDGGEPRLALSLSASAGLPGLPLRVHLDGAGIELPMALSPATRPGLDPSRLRELFPDGIGTELNVPPISGGGLVRRTPDQGYGGLISIDLGVLRLQAVALFRPPDGKGSPTSFLVLLAAQFPPPGIQLGLGFALDAVGGLVGVNRRVDITALQQLVGDGNADQLLFPDRAVERATEIIGSLGSAFPVAAGRVLVGPMVRITWGGRMVSLSGALILELPAPARAVLVGRLLVGLPDPVVPLIRLQASVLGRIEPAVPLVELLVSLSGSWIVGLAVRGEMYLLVRGGQQPQFVLSAGGFHPRYTRPAGVPALRRLQVDLAPGNGFGLRMEAYFAITSNAVMFGGQVQLDASIAGCGVQGWLGLDALFVFDPVFAFSVHVRAGVAVRAFGRRLAGIGLDFTLEGPAPWHAFGTGSISVLFWDVELDFDVRWGSAKAVRQEPGRSPLDALTPELAKTTAWAAERPAAERTALLFTPEANEKLNQGSLVHPDATLRLTQRVVPLGVPISRFERRPVPAQTWTVKEVALGTPQPPDQLVSLPERFVPGEFFDLTEDQQLTEPAFVSHAGGLRARVDGVQVGDGHRVDDTYETKYEPPLPERQFTVWPGFFRREAVFALGAAERLARWRTPEAVVKVRPPRLSVAAAATLEPLLDDVTLVNATTDAWDAVRGQLAERQDELQLVETWELRS
ncbi:DUF6603 domain-containing protein [Streptomyces turgidiscabies]|uniref:DUF6603 domain-containing protein n=1 Tax=Streptomyces turgidiscabies (strain Car8) TaxID=698760 RepID=L7ERV6_STRT8|nr:MULTISPECIES: DUF6603 domain-containing protein [Streptomyces]ELP62148.1 hypothetical protein STRTUCAR8_00219 [Streptomyces turgidiscabies Car8]MDX3498149.1 hypothetical protein [Streptomyces turgidiscabies]GAQ75121.1 hypothetical protein T45_06902 [Streptomyces turgidiscabies]